MHLGADHGRGQRLACLEHLEHRQADDRRPRLGGRHDRLAGRQPPAAAHPEERSGQRRERWGIRINSNGNNVSWNDVSGNGGPGGILVAGNSNTLKGGTVGPNNGDGIKITGSSNTVSGATVDSNTGNGVFVSGGSNQIKSNKANLNGADGFQNFGGASNKYSGNSSNTGGKENAGAEYRFVTAGVNGGSNRADGVNVPKTSAPTKCADFAQAGTVCE